MLQAKLGKRGAASLLTHQFGTSVCPGIDQLKVRTGRSGELWLDPLSAPANADRPVTKPSPFKLSEAKVLQVDIPRLSFIVSLILSGIKAHNEQLQT